MTFYNYVISYGFFLKKDDETEAIYACMLKNLIEMCLTPGTIRVGENRRISYANVIDQINCIYHKVRDNDDAFYRSDRLVWFLP